MASQDAARRRKPATYGKQFTRRHLPANGFFGPEPTTEPSTSSLISPDLIPHHTQPSGLAAKRNPGSLNEEPKEDSSDQTQDEKADTLIFEVESSGEEGMGMPLKQHATKKRRLTPVERSAQRARVPARQTNAKVTSISTEDLKLTETGLLGISQNPQSRSSSSPKSLANSLAVNPRLKAESASRDFSKKPAASGLIADHEDIQATDLASTPTPPRTPGRSVLSSPRSVKSSPSPSTQDLDRLCSAVPQADRSSKLGMKLGELLHQATGAESPSQLGLKSLRLTSEPSSKGSRNVRQDAGPSKTTLTPSRSRRRLVDALDSPRKRSQSRRVSEDGSDPAEDAPQSSIIEREVTNGTQTVKERREQPASRTGTMITYGKQRSYLSEMVTDDLTSLNAPSIADLVDPAVPAIPVLNNNFCSQKSQEDLGRDDDQPVGTIRSIHELRQAGVNARFQSNLDSIFEDVEASGQTSKARRIRGLISLSEKFVEPGFSQQFCESNMHQRLATCAVERTDILNSLLSTAAVLILFGSCQPPVKVFQQMFDAVILSASQLLLETEKYPKFVKGIAKDRKQNLSGATCRDILDFHETLLKSSAWDLDHPGELTPQLIALRSIELAVCGLRELGDFTTILPPSAFEKLVIVIDRLVVQASVEFPSSGSSMALTLALSILEYSALSVGKDEYHESAKRLVVLGRLLSSIGVQSRCKVQQLTLRLVLSLTNRNEKLCDSLGQSSLFFAIFDIVRNDFTGLTVRADNGEDLDEATLESVILALGALINFAECSSSSRLVMDKIHTTSGCMTEWLVQTFNNRAGKAEEVSLSIENRRV